MRSQNFERIAPFSTLCSVEHCWWNPRNSAPLQNITISAFSWSRQNSSSMDEVRYTLTERGARKLIYRGYLFTKHREVKDGVSWRCVQRGKCRGRVMIDEDDQVLSSADHSHDPDWGTCRATETVVAIKRAAETSRAPTEAIIQSKVARLSSETAMKLPKVDSLKKTVRRVKRQNLPPEPKSLGDLNELPARFTRTLSGKCQNAALIRVNDQMLVFLTV